MAFYLTISGILCRTNHELPRRTFVIGTPRGMTLRPKSDANDGAIGVPGDGADFRLDAAFLGGVVGESQSEGLDERIGVQLFFPIRSPIVESADGRVMNQNAAHYRLAFSKKRDQTC